MIYDYSLPGDWKYFFFESYKVTGNILVKNYLFESNNVKISIDVERDFLRVYVVMNKYRRVGYLVDAQVKGYV